MARERMIVKFQENTRDWPRVEIKKMRGIQNENIFYTRIRDMEREALEAINEYEEAYKAHRENKSMFAPSADTVESKYLRALKKETKINLVYSIVAFPGSRSSIDSFNLKVSEMLQNFTLRGLKDVLDGRTAYILNDIYKAIGGEENGFFPTELKEYYRKHESKYGHEYEEYDRTDNDYDFNY